MPDNSLPLSGVRVIDFTDGTAGFAGRFLADLGADVMLVEPPEGAASRRAQPQHDGHGLRFATAHANKRGIVRGHQHRGGARDAAEIDRRCGHLSGVPPGRAPHRTRGRATKRCASATRDWSWRR